MSARRIALIVPAGGSGVRAGSGRKQYADLCGEPVLLRALRPFLRIAGLEWIVVALPADAPDAPAWLTGFDARVRTVAGGAERTDSVRNALAVIPHEADVIVVHDAARPLVTTAVIERTLAAVDGCGVIAALPVVETIKEVDDARRITGTPDRTRLWSAQTPQAFPRTLLANAHARAQRDGVGATDDAMLVERYGGTVIVVEGSPSNIKLTTPADFAIARALLQDAPQEA